MASGCRRKGVALLRRDNYSMKSFIDRKTGTIAVLFKYINLI